MAPQPKTMWLRRVGPFRAVGLAALVGLGAAALGCQAAVPAPAKEAKPAASQPAAQEKPAAAPAPAKEAKPQAPEAAKPASQSAKPATKALKKIVVNTAGPSMLYAPLHLAIFNGYLADEGFEPELIEPAGGAQAAQVLVAGNALLGAFNVANAVDAVLRNQPLVVVAPTVTQNGNAMVVSKEWAQKHSITPQMPLADRVKALKGARIGTVGPRSGADDAIRFVLRAVAGMNPDKDAELMPLGGSANFPPAIEKKQIDAGLTASPAIEVMIVRGHADLTLSLMAGDVPDLRGQLFQGIVVRRDRLEREREDVLAALRAVLRGQKFLAEKPDDAKRIIYERKFKNIEPEVWDLAWKNNYPAFAKTPDMTEAGYKLNFTMVRVGRGEQVDEVPFERIVDTKIAQEALRTMR